MGKEAIRLLKFAIRFHGWHTLATGTCQSTRRAIRTLERLGFIEINGHHQYRLYERE
jgi:hypothetical protein